MENRFSKLICLVICLVFPAFAGEKANNKWYQKKRVAFLVGVNHYEATTSLKYAAIDPEKLEPLFAEAGYFDKIVTLNDAGKMVTTLDKNTWEGKRTEIDPSFKPTEKMIRNIFSELVNEKPDMLLFYFSGHGFISGEEGKNTIAPTDISLDENNEPLNGITLDSLSNQTDSLNQVVFLIDACRNPLPEKSQTPIANSQIPTAKNPKPKTKFQSLPKPKTFQLSPDFSEELPLDVETAKGIVILIGTAQNDYSLENEDLKGGAFTYFLRLGLQGEIGQERAEEFTTTENIFTFTDNKLKIYFEDVSRFNKNNTKKKAKDVYQITTERGFRGDFLITYGRPSFIDPNYEDGIKRKLAEDYSHYLYYDPVEDRNILAKRRYGKNGNIRELRFFGREEKTKNYFPESLEGVHRMEYDLGSNPISSKDFDSYYATQYNLENKPIYNFQMEKYFENGKHIGWEYRGVYKQTEEDRKDPERKEIQYERKIFDFDGRVLLEEYFDSKGKDEKLAIKGVATIKRQFGKVTKEEYFDLKGNPTLRNGYATYILDLTDFGEKEYESWYDRKGKLTKNESGVAKIYYVYDLEDRLILQLNFDEQIKLTNSNDGVAQVQYVYDDTCLRIKKERLLQFAEDKEKAKSAWKREGYKACLTQVLYFNKENNPVSNKEAIHKKQFTFDDKGNKISEEYFRSDGRSLAKNGVAKKVHDYDEDGNIIKTSHYGPYEIEGKLFPVPDELDVHAYTYSYNFNNKDCLKTRQKQGTLYKEYDCADTIQHLGIDGKLIENTEGVTRVKIWYDGTSQKEALREYYGIENKYIRSNKVVGRAIIFDSSFNLTLEADYTVKDGKETLSSKEVYEYDKKGNKTLYAFYDIKDGKETLDRKYVYKYDEKGNQTLYARYRLRDEKETLSSKSVYKYDEKGNQTLETSYELKDGKETLAWKKIYKYDEKGNQTLEAGYTLKDGKKTLAYNKIYEYDEGGNKTLAAGYTLKDGKDMLNRKHVYEYDKNGNKTLDARYELKDGKETLDYKWVYEYDEKGKLTLNTSYRLKDGKETLSKKHVYKYDKRGNQTLDARYRLIDGKETLDEKYVYKYDEKGNKTLDTYYTVIDGKETIGWKYVWEYDENGNKTLYAYYTVLDGKETIGWKYVYKYHKVFNEINDFYLNFFDKKTTSLDPKAKINKKDSIQSKKYTAEKLAKDQKKTKVLKEIDDAWKEYVAKKKKYTLVYEDFNKNGTFKVQEYKLLFMNPRGSYEDRLIRVDLDRFYRPVRVVFEEK